MGNSPFVLVTSPEMAPLARSVQEKLRARGRRLSLHTVEYTRFANGEELPWIPNTVRRQHVFFFHPLLHPDPANAFMRLLMVNNALSLADVERITFVTPYMSYLRQDRKDKARVPITGSMIAEKIMVVDNLRRQIITMDMHSDQAQGFFNNPVDNLTSMDLFADYFRKKLGPKLKNAVVVTPDIGGNKRAVKFAGRLGVPVAICDKHRPKPNVSTIRAIGGAPIKGHIAIMYDDMIDTGGTTINAATTVRDDFGATEVYAAATHGLFSGNAVERFKAAGFPVVVTDSIPRTAEWVKDNPWLTTISIDDLLAKTLYEQTLRGGSVSKLTW